MSCNHEKFLSYLVKSSKMVLVFPLPFCLLLPDGDYPIKLGDNDIVNLNLTKVIPKIYDERLPYRGFLKGELNNISKLRIMFRNESKEIKVNDLSTLKDLGTVIKYYDKQNNEVIPQLLENDVNVHEPGHD